MLRKSNNLSVSPSVRIVAHHVVTTRQLWQPGECVIQASVTNTMVWRWYSFLLWQLSPSVMRWNDQGVYGGLNVSFLGWVVWRQQCLKKYDGSSALQKTYADGQSGMQTEMTKIQNKCYDVDWRWGWGDDHDDEKRYGLQMLWGWLMMRVYEVKEFEGWTPHPTTTTTTDYTSMDASASTLWGQMIMSWINQIGS